MTATTRPVCAACGKELPKSRAGGRPRKWCSERCRKSQYDRECIDCGARIDGTTPSRCGGRCMPCANKIPRLAHVAHRQTIEAMWAEGRTILQVCEAMGLKPNAEMISVWRARGYDLPHRRTPEQVARITAASAENLAKARAVLDARRAVA